MASTSTNKQPLLIDRVFNNVIALDAVLSGNNSSINIEGTNSAAVLVNCISNDGALVEDLWTIARSTFGSKVLFFLSTAADYLRTTEAVYIGDITSSSIVGQYTGVAALPKVLAPVPQQGNTTGLADGAPLKNQALYVPTGKALWVALQASTAPATGTAPIVGAQGGFF